MMRLVKKSKRELPQKAKKCRIPSVALIEYFQWTSVIDFREEMMPSDYQEKSE